MRSGLFIGQIMVTALIAVRWTAAMAEDDIYNDNLSDRAELMDIDVT